MASLIDLEEFEPDQVSQSLMRPNSADPNEMAQLDAYETGYKAGWDDAIKAKEIDLQKASSELCKNLQQISFTYYEARAKVLSELKPLLVELTGKFLPALARENVELLISESLSNLSSEAQVEISTTPNEIDALQTLLDQTGFKHAVISGDASLGDNEILLRVGDTEKMFDPSIVVQSIQDSVQGFFEIALAEAQ